MKLVIISDTHQREPDLPDGDVLIHCGDLTFHGGMRESIRQLEWLSVQSHKHKLVIAGNHELGWETNASREWLFRDFPRLRLLHNDGVEIYGLKFWGSPVQPYFHGWAFQKQRSELKAHWASIPEGTDVLITHGPPKGFGDTNQFDERFGDEDLLNRVLEVKPAVHCYGHAHHGYGRWAHEYDGHKTIFINAAVLDEDYKLKNAPWIVGLIYDDKTKRLRTEVSN